jgi:hypothetical protein
MEILIIGAVFAVLLLIVPRLLGRSRESMLAQYEILEKRFRLQRKTYPSKWGKGIGERYALSGDFHGYPISLYDHYRGSGQSKETWTSLTLEMLFSGELEIVLERVDGGDLGARFARADSLMRVDAGLENFEVYTNSDTIIESLLNKSTCEQITEFQGMGCFRLSKGFFEYRESGQMGDAAMRIRFQEALRLLADLGDRLSELKEVRDDRKNAFPS